MPKNKLKEFSMKKVIVTAAAVSLMSVSAYAGGMAGCGLGSMIFKKNDQVSQILAATTNGISGNQTFGITTGTLGCNPDGAMAQNEELNIFTSKNMEKLAADMSKGQGETLNTFAELKGVSADKKPQFFAAVQKNFSKIFTKENITAGEVLKNVNSVI